MIGAIVSKSYLSNLSKIGIITLIFKKCYNSNQIILTIQNNFSLFITLYYYEFNS